MLTALRRIIGDRAFIAAAAAAVASGMLLYELRGREAVERALRDDAQLFVTLLVFVPAVLLLSALVQVLMPKGLVERWLGGSSGFRGMAVATIAGALTPGGPFMAFPIVYALYRAGADWGPLVAYATAWLLLSVIRTLVFEIPLVGVELPAVRFVVCLALPAVAGLTARWVARAWRPPPRPGAEGSP